MNNYEDIIKEIIHKVHTVTNESELFQVKSYYLSKQGSISKLSNQIKNLPEAEKKVFGKEINALKERVQKIFQERLTEINLKQANDLIAKAEYDITFRTEFFKDNVRQGGYHPLTLVKREIEDLFSSMGFQILDGSFIEDEFHNFTALNIPANHPARDMQDTFWFNQKYCLRTHASPIEIRAMQNLKPPFKFIASAKVFRNEEIDASHEVAFHQIEGMVVDKKIGIHHMLHFLNTLVKEILGEETKTRLRNGFFPFVEPGFELDITCHLCKGSGCNLCKNSGWLEFCGCGLTHPKVLESGNLNPKEWSGFAFGLGWDRLTMIRYGIEDIRHMHAADLRFIQQFRIY